MGEMGEFATRGDEGGEAFVVFIFDLPCGVHTMMNDVFQVVRQAVRLTVRRKAEENSMAPQEEMIDAFTLLASVTH